VLDKTFLTKLFNSGSPTETAFERFDTGILLDERCINNKTKIITKIKNKEFFIIYNIYTYYFLQQLKKFIHNLFFTFICNFNNFNELSNNFNITGNSIFILFPTTFVSINIISNTFIHNATSSTVIFCIFIDDIFVLKKLVIISIIVGIS
jgi:hypothetical protein